MEYNSYVKRNPVTQIKQNRSKSPIEKFLDKQRMHNFTEHSVLNKRNSNLSQQSNHHLENKTLLMPPEENPNSSEYAEEQLKTQKLKQKIRFKTNKNLVHGDLKSLKSIKLLLKKTNKSLNLLKHAVDDQYAFNVPKTQNEYAHPLYLDKLNPYNRSNLSMQINRNDTIDVDENLGFTWNYLNESMKNLEEKTAELKNGPNWFKTPSKFLHDYPML